MLNFCVYKNKLAISHQERIIKSIEPSKNYNYIKTLLPFLFNRAKTIKKKEVKTPPCGLYSV